MKTLFKNAEEFAEFIPITLEMDRDFKKLPPQIENAQRSFIAKEIGSEFLKELIDAHHSEEGGSELQKEAIAMVQAPLANYTMYLYLPKHKVQIDSQGIRVAEDDNNKDAKPFDTAQALDAYLRDAYTGIEHALEFFESNRGSFTTWRDSQASTTYAKSLIRSISELEAETGIPVTRRLFRFIRPHIKRVERQQLRAILGDELLEDVLAQIAENTVTAATKQLLEIARPAVAFTALADALVLMELEWSDLGLTVLSISTNTNVTRGKTAAPDRKITNTVNTCLKLGPEQLGLLSEFLRRNAANYPKYKSPEKYSGGTIDNDPDSGIFATF